MAAARSCPSGSSCHRRGRLRRRRRPAVRAPGSDRPTGPGTCADEAPGDAVAAAEPAGCSALYPETMTAETALATLPAWEALARLLRDREDDTRDLAIAE